MQLIRKSFFQNKSKKLEFSIFFLLAQDIFSGETVSSQLPSRLKVEFQMGLTFFYLACFYIVGGQRCGPLGRGSPPIAKF